MTDLPGLTVTYSVQHTTATEINTPAVLLTNNDARSPNIDRPAYTDSSHNLAPYDSCYKADCTSSSCTDMEFGLRVNFDKTVFLHALLMVLDILDANKGTVNSWTIWCKAEDGTETICGTYDTSGIIQGFEGWINKEVVAIRIVGTPVDPTNWKATICMLGPMGTSYVHLNPVPASLAIQQGQQAADLIIDHITAETGFEITNVLDINLR